MAKTAKEKLQSVMLNKFKKSLPSEFIHTQGYFIIEASLMISDMGIPNDIFAGYKDREIVISRSVTELVPPKTDNKFQLSVSQLKSFIKGFNPKIKSSPNYIQFVRQGDYLGVNLLNHNKTYITNDPIVSVPIDRDIIIAHGRGFYIGYLKLITDLLDNNDIITFELSVDRYKPCTFYSGKVHGILVYSFFKEDY